MCPATGHIIPPIGQGHLPFSQCQHTPSIAKIIFSPAETYERLKYDVNFLSCNRKTRLSSIRVMKMGAPDIEIIGNYAARLPHTPIVAHMVHALSTIPPYHSITYGGSMKTFIYENIKTGRICPATHATFNKAKFNTLPHAFSPNSKALWTALSWQPVNPLIQLH
jgi:hypothetical protein